MVRLQKILKTAPVLFLCLCSVKLALAGAPSEQISVLQTQGGSTGAYFALRLAGPVCEGTLDAPGADQLWTTLAPDLCREVFSEIRAKKSSLESDETQLSIPMGTLRLNNETWNVTLLNEESCDATLKHCTRTPMSAASEFAVSFRQKLAKALNAKR